MLPFDVLPRMAVVHLMKTVIFYVNAFVWLKGVSQTLSPLSIVEGTVLDFNLHFKVIFGEFVQTCEGTDNTMKARTVDALALGPNGNLQGGIRCYSLDSGKILQRGWKDVQVYKMPQSAISRIKYICGREKSVKGLHFGDRQNKLDESISTGVIYESSTLLHDESLNEVNSEIAYEDMDDSIRNIADEEDDDEDIVDNEDANNDTSEDTLGNEDNDNTENEDATDEDASEIAVVDRDDEFDPPSQDENVARTRSR